MKKTKIYYIKSKKSIDIDIPNIYQVEVISNCKDPVIIHFETSEGYLSDFLIGIEEGEISKTDFEMCGGYLSNITRLVIESSNKEPNLVIKITGEK